MAATLSQRPWTFDVAALMVLVNEEEETNYRLSQRSYLECLVTAPVVGLQSYVRSYDFLLNTSQLQYFTPIGVKNAPLRYMCLSNAIKKRKLLEDNNFNVFQIRKWSNRHQSLNSHDTWMDRALITLWVLFTWTVFAGLMTFAITSPKTTWIGTASCSALTGWSMMLRLIERININPSNPDDAKITLPDEFDAVYILGRNNSAVVLEGTRKDIKYWTFSIRNIVLAYQLGCGSIQHVP